MASVKTLLLGAVITSATFSKCTPSSHVGTRNPVLQQVVGQSYNDQLKRAYSIAAQEREEPKGVIFHHKDFVETKTAFYDMDRSLNRVNSRLRTTLGMNLDDSTFYLRTNDKHQQSLDGSSGGCDAGVTVYIGQYKDMPGQVQVLFDNVQILSKLEENKRKSTMPAPLLREQNDNVVDMYQLMARGFSRFIRVNLNDSTVANSVCGCEGPATRQHFNDNPRKVEMAKNFADKNDKPTRRFQAYTRQ